MIMQEHDVYPENVLRWHQGVGSHFNRGNYCNLSYTLAMNH